MQRVPKFEDGRNESMKWTCKKKWLPFGIQKSGENVPKIEYSKVTEQKEKYGESFPPNSGFGGRVSIFQIFPVPKRSLKTKQKLSEGSYWKGHTEGKPNFLQKRLFGFDFCYNIVSKVKKEKSILEKLGFFLIVTVFNTYLPIWIFGNKFE